ncbi:MAG: hypothetical protein WAQ28_00795 [Bacteroidia bacterium]
MSAKIRYYFPINKILFLLVLVFNNYIYAQSPLPQNNPLADEVFSICDKVESEGRIAGNVPENDNASLPIGIAKTIAGTQYVIAVDSARFMPDKALCSAFMAVDLPGSMDRIAFAAKNIAINPKGVMSSNNSRLMLVSEHHIKISQKVMLILKDDGTNYIEWDCNGFKTINLKGYFEFSNTILIPDSSSSTPNGKVIASFEIHTNDIHNFITQVSVTPFTLKGLKDVSFTVLDATVDLSELANAPSMVFPSGYQQSSPDINQWQGFYLKQFTVKLPKELSKKNQGRTTISANNMVIDNSGISGLFSATNVLALGNSDMDSWQFSVDQLNVNIAQNHLNGGGIGGSLKLPLFENNALVYNASFQEDTVTRELNYQFIASAQNNMQATVFSAAIDIYPSSQIIVNKTNGKFFPKGNLSGQIKLNSNAANTGKLDFQNVVITTTAPYIQSGTFGLTTAQPNQNKIGQFPITINQIQVVINPTSPNIYFQVGMNFMSASDQGFAAAAGFRVMTKFVQGGQHPTWKFDRVRIEDIQLNIQTQAFTLEGYVIFRENDPVYGNGFAGGINLGIPSINLDVDINVIFGAVSGYKYFYVDGMVALPTPIVISTGVALYRFMGGLYYHMSQPAGAAGQLYTSAFTSTTPPNYIPNPNIGLGFKAGVTIGMAGKEDAFNADVALEVQFNSSSNGGGISLIKFTGDCFMMTSIEDRKGKTYTQVPVGAFAYIGYNFNAHEFHAILDVGLNYNGIQGQLNSVFHVDPIDWYVYIGKPSQKGIITVDGLATVNSYFMVGNKIEPMAPLPYEIAATFGAPDKRNTADLASASGFAFGADLRTPTGKEYGFDFFTVYGSVYFIVGFDVMMQKYPSSFVCPNTGNSPGFKGWYLKGQLYSYFNAAVGVKGRVEVAGIGKDFDFNVFSGTAAAMLYGELMKPSFVEGKVHCTYEILSVVDGSFDYQFEKGTRCGS